MGIVIIAVGIHGIGGIGPVPGSVEDCPGAGLHGGKLLYPRVDRDILDTDPLGGAFLQFFLWVLNKGEGAGLRGDLSFWVPKLDQGIGEILEAPAAPFPANLPGKAAGTVDGYLEGL